MFTSMANPAQQTLHGWSVKVGVVFAKVLNNGRAYDASLPESYRDFDEIEISRHRTFLIALDI